MRFTPAVEAACGPVDALTHRRRENCRIVNVVTAIATGVNANGLEIRLRRRVVSGRRGAGLSACPRRSAPRLRTRRLTRVDFAALWLVCRSTIAVVRDVATDDRAHTMEADGVCPSWLARRGQSQASTTPS